MLDCIIHNLMDILMTQSWNSKVANGYIFNNKSIIDYLFTLNNLLCEI